MAQAIMVPDHLQQGAPAQVAPEELNGWQDLPADLLDQIVSLLEKPQVRLMTRLPGMASSGASTDEHDQPYGWWRFG